MKLFVDGTWNELGLDIIENIGKIEHKIKLWIF